MSGAQFKLIFENLTHYAVDRVRTSRKKKRHYTRIEGEIRFEISKKISGLGVSPALNALKSLSAMRCAYLWGFIFVSARASKNYNATVVLEMAGALCFSVFLGSIKFFSGHPCGEWKRFLFRKQIFPGDARLFLVICFGLG